MRMILKNWVNSGKAKALVAMLILSQAAGTPAEGAETTGVGSAPVIPARAPSICIYVDENIVRADAKAWDNTTTPWQVGTDASQIDDLLAAVHKDLDDNDAPQEGRYIVWPTVGAQALRVHVSGRATNLGDQVAMTAQVGEFGGFRHYVSRNVTLASTTYHCPAGVMGDGVALAVQVNPEQIEQLRLEASFATGVRARVLAGHVVYRSGLMVDVNINSTFLA